MDAPSLVGADLFVLYMFCKIESRSTQLIPVETDAERLLSGLGWRRGFSRCYWPIFNTPILTSSSLAASIGQGSPPIAGM